MEILNKKKEDKTMKKTLFAISAIAVLLGFTACTSENEILEPQVSGKTITIKAYTEENTRTTLSGNDKDGYKVFWSTDDAIKIGESTFTLTDGAETTSGTFTGDELTDDTEYTAYYPADYDGENWPTAQTYTAGNITGSPMKATFTYTAGGEEPSLSFKNEGGILRLNLKLKEGDAARSVKKIVVSSTQLAEDIELNCETAVALSEAGIPFHIAVPAKAYSDLKFTIFDDGAYKCVRTLSTGNTLTVERSKITPVNLTAKTWEFFGLCFTAAEASTVSINSNGDQLEYSLNDGEWTEWANNTPISMASADKVYLRLKTDGTWTENYSTFQMSGSLAASGNIMSLVDRTGFSKEIPLKNCFYKLFKDCSLTSAPELPATTLASGCYYYMFSGCSLTTAPELPATTLASECYYCMFYKCLSLTTAPELPATTLASGCYYSMFSDCSSLATAPVLRAPILTEYCYDSMFYKCKNIKSVTCLATDISATNCLYGWLNQAGTTGTIYVAKGMSGSWAAPSRWKIVEIE